MSFQPAAAALLAGLVAAGPARTQQIPEARLNRAEARYPEPFSAIAGLRPLPDGRILVTDRIEGTLLRIDLRTGQTDTLGRQGAGPGEYKSPDLVFPIEGGKSLLVDLGNGRLSVFDATGKYVQSQSLVRGDPGPGMLLLIPRGTDAQGRLYLQPSVRGPGSPGGPGAGGDSAAIVRYDPGKEHSDTLARVGLPETRVTSSGGADNRNVMMRAVPLSPQDAWAVGADGRIAIVRAGDYHLDWVLPGGRVVRGRAVPYRPVSVGDADKREFLDQQAATGLRVSVNNENGRVSMSFGRGGPVPRDANLSQFEWPATKPPFTANGVWVTAEGEAWVERSVPAGSPAQYDVFGAEARVVRRVVLPAQRRVIGFGPGAVYVRHTDPEDGLQYLERYGIPR